MNSLNLVKLVLQLSRECPEYKRNPGDGVGWEEAEGSSGPDPVVCSPVGRTFSLILRPQGAPIRRVLGRE